MWNFPTQKKEKEKYMFSKAEFILSAASPADYPELLTISGKPMAEIALVGRSNVGKSSLLNHLTQNKTLARVSSTPGKTQLINFFVIDDHFALVDLPGYGFAKVPKEMREQWGDLIQDYLQKRKKLSLILLLLDSRHLPTQEDIQFARWAIHYKKPLIIVFTKTDKLAPSAALSQCAKSFTLLSDAINAKPIAYFSYSIKNAKGRIALIKEIEKRIQ